MLIGDKILTLRKQLGLSQEQLADQLEVSRQAVSKWESGQSVPELDKLPKLARMFDVSIDYLVDNALDEDVPHVRSASGTEDDPKQFWFPFCLGLLIIGLLVAVFVWREVQTLVPIAAGLAVQVLGVVFFEAFGMSGESADEKRRRRVRFYGVAIWLLAPLPIYMLVQAAFTLYPRAYPALTPYIVSMIFYLGLSLTTTFVIRRKR